MCTSYKMHRVLLEAAQYQVAARAGISCRRLRAIERGQSAPTAEEKEALIRVFRKLSRSQKAGKHTCA